MARDFYEESAAPKDFYADKKASSQAIEKAPERDIVTEIGDRLIAGVGDLGQNLVQNYGKLTGNNIEGRDDLSAILANIKGMSPREGAGWDFLQGAASQGPSVIGGLTKRILGGGAIGAATSENPLQGALMGALTGVIPYAASGAKKIGAGISDIKNAPLAKLGANIASSADVARNKYSKLYSSVLDAADSSIDKFHIPSKLNSMREDAKYLFENASDAKLDALQDFMTNPNFTSGHWAKSEMGKLYSSLKKNQMKDNVGRKTMMAAKNLQDGLDDAMKVNFNRAEVGDLGALYKNLGPGYKKEVLPYQIGTRQKGLLTDQLKQNEISPETLAKKYLNNERYTLNVGKNMPGVKTNLLLKSPILKEALKYAGYAGVGALGYHSLGH